jgi:hypothetical protein
MGRLRICIRAARNRLSGRVINTEPVSLLTLVCTEPQRFDNTGFVFMTAPSLPEDVEAAQKALTSELGSGFKDHISSWPPANIYTNFTIGYMKVWPRQFISFWKSNSESPLAMSARVGAHYTHYKDEQGAIFTDPPDWRAFAKRVGGVQHLLPKCPSDNILSL